jgi:shikimate kinase
VITVVIGQRGTGKTQLLNRIAKYSKNAKCIDLDQYIEKSYRKSISQIFQQKGETYFRKIEKEKFAEIIEKAKLAVGNFYISVGGGFDCALIPNFIRILWVRRISEQWGRIFTDRPRLNPEISPIEEFLQRAKPRAEKFAQCAWEEYLIPEGLRREDTIEKSIILNSIENIKGGLTLLPNMFIKSNRLNFYLNRRLGWGIKFFEIRDDLLNKTQFKKIVKIIPREQLLFSLRSSKVTLSEYSKIKNQVQWIDCDQTLINKYPLEDITIISRHHRTANDSLTAILNELEPFEVKGLHIKLAVEINNFDELILGHNWFKKNPTKRSFLPRSKDGRWQWYRLLMQGQMFVEFFREGEGSALDQPTLYQWLSGQRIRNINKRLASHREANSEDRTATQFEFAALLGEPVSHSFTPIEQASFFEKKQMLVLAINLGEDEFKSGLKVLRDLGLRAAAVTSPLKKLAFQFADEKTKEVSEFATVNTLVLKRDKTQWLGTNTDLQGLRVLLKGIYKYVIAVWGGGGTLPLLQKLLPKAFYFSAQFGVLRDSQKVADEFSPEFIIWAAPRADGKNVLLPPGNWRPKAVIDLNYREDSGGRDYALKCGAKYISGEKMFYAQAHHQRVFWQKHL